MNDYHAVESRFMPHHWEILDPKGERVDIMRTVAGAAYGARLLNEAMATVNHHAPVGCRIEITR
jgi:hypothetical protein